MKTLSKISLLILSLVLIFSVVMPGFAKSQTTLYNQSIQEQIDALIENYQKNLEHELMFGETVEVEDPLDGKITLLAGESAVKIEKLWQETISQVNELSARPPEERDIAVKLIQSLEVDEPVTYIDQDRSPYNPNAKLERYQAGKYIYAVDTATNQIVEITLLDDRIYSTEPIYSKDELEKMAREFIYKIAGDTKLDNLSPQYGDKEGITFFFRWEDKSQKLEGGMAPFIQVGFSQGGDIVHYVNTLPFAKRTFVATTFNEIYANGGSFWQWLTGSYNTQNNAGYCYIAGWCSPKNFYYQNTCWGCESAKGRWKPNPNSTVKASAFVPSTHATTLMACYRSFYNGGSSLYERCINQSIYYNVWVSITATSLYNIRRIELPNLSDASGTREVAWDEVWVYTP